MGKIKIGFGLSCLLAAFVVFGLITFVGANVASAADPVYVGVIKCKGCHKKQFKVWEGTKHAKAFSLLNADQQKDEKCVGCHVTGYGKAAKEGAKLENVQCEACHGPGSKFKSMKIMSKKKFKADRAGQHAKALAAGLIIPGEDDCKKCHNEKNPNFKPFNFKEMFEKIKH